MDINSLLSPSDLPRAASLTPTSPAAATPPAPSPFKNVPRTQSGTGLQPVAGSPLTRPIQPPSSIPAHVRSPLQQPPHSSPLISPVPSATASVHFSRSSATPGIDALTDLSSIQQPSKPSLPSRESTDSQMSTSALFPTLTALNATSHPRTSIDIAMVTTPKLLLRSNYTNTSLPAESQQRLSVLVAYVQDAPSSYEAHKEIIKILHRGFVDHIYPSSSPNARRDPRAYDVLPELRLARENFDKLFAVGEEQWLDWLQDESILAHTADERVAVVDKCRRAVTEEYGSTRLWVAYGDWILHCHKWAHDTVASDATGTVEETERLVGREVFDWALVLDTWAEGIARTKHDMANSHDVWDKYISVRFGNVGEKLTSADAAAVLDLFLARLRVPHVQWQRTFETFSTFITANIPAEQYESVMASTLKDSAVAKQLTNDRDAMETAIQEARRLGDQAVEFQAFTTYIEWERAESLKDQAPKKPKGRRHQRAMNTEFDPVDALHQRAELRFPAVLTVWEDHIDYMMDKPKSDLLEVLARATKHCPWSGSLWKQYLLTSELAEESFDETEKIKHKATSTGLLDAAGIEEALIVYDAWCGYLLRRTKRLESTEEDADVAEVGIRSSIEAVHSIASKMRIGPDLDPSFRLQRKYVEYLKSQRRFDNARVQFDDAIPDYGKHYKFWLRFYEFELQKGVQMALMHRTSPERLAAISSAPFAAAILKQGLEHPDLDYPEPLMEALLNHCEDYEDAEELESALSLVHKVQKGLAARREREAQQANDVAIESIQVEDKLIDHTDDVANGLHIGKRKREDDIAELDTTKRYKTEEEPQETIEPHQASGEGPKRDREHASVLVQNLPDNIVETSIRQFFSSCGTVKHLKLLRDQENSVVVEFEDADAAEYATSRDGVELEGSVLSVVLNTGSTLYVTNYPAAADELYLRDLFRPYGDIVNVRFPSLQRNKKRRFCYVQFKLPQEAQAATELDDKEIDGLHVVVKISNPAIRQTRADNVNDGRTIFLGQLPFKATSDDIERAFARYGKVEALKVPTDPKHNNRNRGIAFLTFATASDAQAALSMDGQEFMQRKITAHLATDTHGKKPANNRSKSPSIQPDGDGASPRPNHDTVAAEDRKQRTIAVCDVPDTVNDVRIKTLAEKIGPIRKVLLKTNHQGALIEFEAIADAGRAMIELDGHEIDPGRRIRVTSEKEMLQQGPEQKQEQFAKHPAQAAVTSGPIKRPAQPGIRKGGHLGQRTMALHKGPVKDGAAAAGEDAGGKKTNDDFRKLINKT